jgi:hypothetical protein
VTTLDVYRWFPRCDWLFEGPKVVGVDETEVPVRCPDCGTPGERLIGAEDRG